MPRDSGRGELGRQERLGDVEVPGVVGGDDEAGGRITGLVDEADRERAAVGTGRPGDGAEHAATGIDRGDGERARAVVLGVDDRGPADVRRQPDRRVAAAVDRLEGPRDGATRAGDRSGGDHRSHGRGGACERAGRVRWSSVVAVAGVVVVGTVNWPGRCRIGRAGRPPTSTPRQRPRSRRRRRAVSYADDGDAAASAPTQGLAFGESRRTIRTGPPVCRASQRCSMSVPGRGSTDPIGCTRRSRRLPREAVGSELDAKLAARARERGFDVRAGDAQALDLGRTFDVVWAGELIEHLSCAGAFLDGARRHLEPGGRLVLTTPNAFAVSNFVYRIGGRPRQPGAHVLVRRDDAVAALATPRIRGRRGVVPAASDPGSRARAARGRGAIAAAGSSGGEHAARRGDGVYRFRWSGVITRVRRRFGVGGGGG